MGFLILRTSFCGALKYKCIHENKNIRRPRYNRVPGRVGLSHHRHHLHHRQHHQHQFNPAKGKTSCTRACIRLSLTNDRLRCTGWQHAAKICDDDNLPPGRSANRTLWPKSPNQDRTNRLTEISELQTVRFPGHDLTSAAANAWAN